jgi:hypothetical protein
MSNLEMGRYDLYNLCIDLGINLKRHCDLYKVILKTTNTTTIAYPQSGFNCSGYFIAFPNLTHPLMGFAMGIEINDLIPTILHEWSHMDQWYENDINWTNNMYLINDTYKESVDIMDEWISGAEIINIDTYIKSAIDVELDCEIRTIKKLYQLHLDDKLKFSIDEYIQKANAYIYLYQYVKEVRNWNITGKAPYLIKDVWSKFPTTFENDYSILKDEYKELYSIHCYK